MIRRLIDILSPAKDLESHIAIQRYNILLLIILTIAELIQGEIYSGVLYVAVMAIICFISIPILERLKNER